MEVYVLDGLLRRTVVIDIFESLIWTERYADVGDFELIINSTPAYRNLFVTGTRLAINESTRVMTVETVENTFGSDGKKVLKLTGRSLEAILDDRALLMSWVGSVGMNPIWKAWSRTPAQEMRYMFAWICQSGVTSPYDIIPNVITDRSLYSPSTIPEPTVEYIEDFEGETLLTATKIIADAFDLGFRLYRDPANAELHYEVYSGSDRTSQQTKVPPVIFAPSMGTLQNVNSIKSIEKSKNVCYARADADVIYYQYQSGQRYEDVNHIYFRAEVLSSAVDETIGGLDRRVLIHDAGRVPEVLVERYVEDLEVWRAANNRKYPTNDVYIQLQKPITDYLIQSGKAALAENRAFSAFDGEINQRGPFKYGKDYELGDLLEERDDDGNANIMRVTEQIFASDANGDQSYPTLSNELYVNQGSWNSWRYNAPWVDQGTGETWANQPV